MNQWCVLRKFFLFLLVCQIFCFSCKQGNTSEKEDTFKVEIREVAHGKITVKDIKGNDFTALNDVKAGAELVFTLKADDGYLPLKLLIDGKEYTNLNSDGNIERKVVVNKNDIVVSGECVKNNPSNKHKITIVNPQGGTITCTKEDGVAIADLNNVENGTKVKIVLQANTGYHAKSLKIAEQTIPATEKKRVEKLWTVYQDLNIQGELIQYFPITINPVQNGEIQAKIKDGAVLTGNDLLEVEKGVVLVFSLKAGVQNFVPKTLSVDGQDYTQIKNGEISIEVVVSKAIVVSGTVEKLTGGEVKLNSITLSNEKIESMLKTPSDVDSQGFIILPAVPTKVEHLVVTLDIEPKNADVVFEPLLQDSKWQLSEGDNTLKITVGGLSYTLKITRVDIEIKTLSMIKEKYPDGGSPENITFTKGDYKTNKHFTFLEDDGKDYLTFALKQGIYECADDDGNQLYKYTATLKTNPPKEISGTFSFVVFSGSDWDMQPPVAIDKKEYSDVDPYFGNEHPNIVLDNAGLGMWIPTHIFPVDFALINKSSGLSEINLVVENISGNVDEDLSEDNTNLISFSGYDADNEFSIKNLKKISISNKAQKILVCVFPKYSVAKVTNISLDGEGTIAPEGNGKDGFYRYIEFSDEAIGERTLTINFRSADESEKKKKTIKIVRSDAAKNAIPISIKVCGVQAQKIEDYKYEVVLPKEGGHIGKVEIEFALEDAGATYIVQTYEYDPEDGWFPSDDITDAEDVNFSEEKNRELGIYVTPKLGILYRKFFDLKVKIAE